MYKSGVETLTSLSFELNARVNELYLNYVKGFVNKDDTRVWKSYYKSQLTLWFIPKWPDFKSSAQKILNEKENQCVREIAYVKITAFRSDKDRWTKGDAFRLVLANLKGALEFIGQKQIANELFDNFDRLEQFVKDGVTENKKAHEKPKQPNVIGGQNQAIEQLVNEEIKLFPKELQHTARQHVSKHANKLLALITFKQQYGI